MLVCVAVTVELFYNGQALWISADTVMSKFAIKGLVTKYF